MERDVQEAVVTRYARTDHTQLSTPELAELSGVVAAAGGSDEAIVQAAGSARSYTSEDLMKALGVDRELADGIVASIHEQAQDRP